MIEQWKVIKGFESSYEVSNFGNVRSLDRKVLHTRQKSVWDRQGKERISRNNGWNQLSKGKVITPVLNDKGYKMVRLHAKGKKSCKTIHRLVAETFIERVDGKNFVNHIDGVVTNNHVNNLEWCTPLENVQHAYRTGLAKVNMPVAIEMLDLNGNVIREFYSTHEAAREVGAQPPNIVKVCRGKRETHHGYKWRYKKTCND